jgi:hypothetical protein
MLTAATAAGLPEIGPAALEGVRPRHHPCSRSSLEPTAARHVPQRYRYRAATFVRKVPSELIEEIVDNVMDVIDPVS